MRARQRLGLVHLQQSRHNLLPLMMVEPACHTASEINDTSKVALEQLRLLLLHLAVLRWRSTKVCKTSGRGKVSWQGKEV
jgi:hypothetical protein